METAYDNKGAITHAWAPTWAECPNVYYRVGTAHRSGIYYAISFRPSDHREKFEKTNAGGGVITNNVIDVQGHITPQAGFTYKRRY